MLKFNPKQEVGFTLLELILIAAVIIALGSIAMVKYSKLPEKARSAEAYAALATIVSAENAYKVDDPNRAYTSNISMLDIDPPASSNFSFTVNSAGSDAAYVTAIGNANTTNSYGMCIKSAKQNNCVGGTGSSCDPGCP